MDKNLKDFIIKLAIFALLLFVIRALFQVPVEYFKLRMFYESNLTRVFSKGDAMKVIAFTGFCFFLAFKSKIEKFHHHKIRWLPTILFFVISLMCVAGYYWLRYLENVYGLAQATQLTGLLVLKFFALALAAFSLLVSVFQIDYLKTVWNHLWREIIITGILMILFYFTMMYFQSQWRFFSGIVSDVLVTLFSFFYKVNVADGSDGTVLTIEDFTISIGSPCSGIDSMLLFIALFGVIFALDHRDIKKGHYAIAFVLGIIGDFIVNNLRLFLLILIGVHISPKLAVGLFHTHAGWILFLLYFMSFYWLVKKFIYKKGFTDKK